MKKHLFAVVAVIMLSAVCFIPCTGFAYAAEDTVSAGYDVRDNYAVELNFGSYFLSNGEVLRSITITLDKAYFLSASGNPIEDFFSSLLGKTSFLQTLNQAFGEAEYKTDYDEKGRLTVIYESYVSVTDMYIEYGIDGFEKDDSDAKVEKSLFFTDYYSYQKTVFDGFEDDENNVFNFILQVVLDQGITRNMIALCYEYGTPYKMISSDAEKVYYDATNRVYIHDFYMDMNSTDREICIKQHAPNATGWYLIALALAAVVALTCIVIAVSANKKRGGEHGRAN